MVAAAPAPVMSNAITSHSGTRGLRWSMTARNDTAPHARDQPKHEPAANLGLIADAMALPALTAEKSPAEKPATPRARGSR
jgi:hypothetical protein